MQYERAFTAYDIARELNVSDHSARTFLKMFGRQVSRSKWIITQPQFRRLQVDGTLMNWMAQYKRGGHENGD